MTEVHAVPEWVRPSAAEVFDLHWLAYRRHLDAEHEVDAAGSEAIAATVVWVWGGLIGPATLRPEQPVTRGVAVAEMWAAMAIGDGGGTPERDLRRACQWEGVRYYPPDFRDVDLEAGMAMYETLCWLVGTRPAGAVRRCGDLRWRFLGGTRPVGWLRIPGRGSWPRWSRTRAPEPPRH